MDPQVARMKNLVGDKFVEAERERVLDPATEGRVHVRSRILPGDKARVKRGSRPMGNFSSVSAMRPEGRREALGVYALLSRVGFPRSYLGKIWAAMFLGTLVPLLAVLLYLVVGSSGSFGTSLPSLAFVLVAVLLSAAVTWYALRGLLAPVRLASSALQEYLDSNKLPELPVGFGDEAGRLMADVRYVVGSLDSSVRSLEALSGTDHLTGIYNRRQGEKLLAEEAAKVRLGRGTLTLAFMDLNELKSINDSHGHQVGDACIRHVAEVIRRNVREGDWLARWGGDEFVLVLHDASPFASTELVLQRIVADLRRSPVKLLQGEELVLTATVGAVRYSADDELPNLLARADEAMYEAKREGRPWILTV